MRWKWPFRRFWAHRPSPPSEEKRAEPVETKEWTQLRDEVRALMGEIRGLERDLPERERDDKPRIIPEEVVALRDSIQAIREEVQGVARSVSPLDEMHRGIERLEREREEIRARTPPVSIPPKPARAAVQATYSPPGSELADLAGSFLAVRDFRDENPALHRKLGTALRNYGRDERMYQNLKAVLDETKRGWKWGAVR